MKLDAIKTVLAAYRSTDATITQAQIEAAWGEHDRAERLIEAQDRLIWMLDTGSPDLAQQVALARADVNELATAIAPLRSEQRSSAPPGDAEPTASLGEDQR